VAKERREFPVPEMEEGGGEMQGVSINTSYAMFFFLRGSTAREWVKLSGGYREKGKANVKEKKRLSFNRLVLPWLATSCERVNKKRRTRKRAKGGERKEGGKGTTKEEGRGEKRSKDITQGSNGGGEEQTLSKRKYITKEPQ
jgi:hypothetical protein